MIVTAITATCGRHTCLERLVRMFLDQDYKGDHNLLIYNNSDIPVDLDASILLPENKTIVIINNHIDYSTGKPYTSLGAIYNDTLQWVFGETDTICFMDDDDLFLPDHINEGVKGLQRAYYRSDGVYKAYKPAQSYFRYQGGISLMNNTLEPSIFVEADHIREYGFSLTTTEQHLQWVNPLVQEGAIYADPQGAPTLIYNWGDTDIPTFKTSGDYKNPLNFDNYRTRSQDHGDKIVTPWKKEFIQPYYKLIDNTCLQ